MSERWIDKHGDIWTLGDNGLMHTPDTAPFDRSHVERKWGPLRLLDDPISHVMTGPVVPAEAVEVAGEAIEDAALRLLGRDLGTVHRDEIATAAISAALPVLLAPLRELREQWVANGVPTDGDDGDPALFELDDVLDALTGGEGAATSPRGSWLSDDCAGDMCDNCVSDRIGCSCQCHAEAPPSDYEADARCTCLIKGPTSAPFHVATCDAALPSEPVPTVLHAEYRHRPGEPGITTVCGNPGEVVDDPKATTCEGCAAIMRERGFVPTVEVRRELNKPTWVSITTADGVPLVKGYIAEPGSHPVPTVGREVNELRAKVERWKSLHDECHKFKEQYHEEWMLSEKALADQREVLAQAIEARRDDFWAWSKNGIPGNSPWTAMNEAARIVRTQGADS